MSTPPIIIAGAGMAAWTVAREWRKLDKDSPLLVVCADDGVFYSKPMLSNALAQNKTAAQLVTQQKEQIAAQTQAEVLAHTQIAAIDCAAHQIQTNRGNFTYSKLVLALGAQPIRIPLQGDAAADVMSVNDIRDYAAFRARLDARAGQKVAILGAGLIGCEFADDMSGAGHQVSLVDLNPRPMALLASPGLSQGLRSALEGRGVQFYQGAAQSVEKQGEGYLLRLADGQSLSADLLLSAVGLRPQIALAQAAGLRCGRGICVDAYGRTSDADVFALGDCAEYQIGETSQVLPYVAPIMAAARAIAKSLCGELTAIEHKNMPVIVKTPSYPLALAPAPAGTPGEWHDAGLEGRQVARFVDAAGVVRGIGVGPQEPALRNRLVAEIGQAFQA
ncbi:FAD-dependent oxidoreductase [Massilia sp. W12]|uniref:NAD(P)/FAD-dependent oxidoreductase n=1 Tax=Massilia sp. W12 TaxID=3126507 RepID=UPI0030D02A13